MMFFFDLWIEHTGLGFTIMIWDKSVDYLPRIYLSFNGQIKLLDHELANWQWEWEAKE